VAHPDLIETARAEFDAVLGDRTNQVDRQRPEVHVEASDLLDLRIDGEVTDEGVRANVSIAVRYLESWLRGVGAAAIDDLMEDAATAEISRAQVWQWIHHGAQLDDGRTIDRALCRNLLDEELAKLRASNKSGRYEEAAELFSELTEAPAFPEFLTMPAYEMITAGVA